MKAQTKNKVYGKINKTAQVGTLNSVTYGVFTRGGEKHIAKYKPYAEPPRDTLCGIEAGTGTRTINDLCEKCTTQAKLDLGKLKFE
jgi:hypothetical protein